MHIYVIYVTSEYQIIFIFFFCGGIDYGNDSNDNKLVRNMAMTSYNVQNILYFF